MTTDHDCPCCGSPDVFILRDNHHVCSKCSHNWGRVDAEGNPTNNPVVVMGHGPSAINPYLPPDYRDRLFNLDRMGIEVGEIQNPRFDHPNTPWTPIKQITKVNIERPSPPQPRVWAHAEATVEIGEMHWKYDPDNRTSRVTITIAEGDAFDELYQRLADMFGFDESPKDKESTE